MDMILKKGVSIVCTVQLRSREMCQWSCQWHCHSRQGEAFCSFWFLISVDKVASLILLCVERRKSLSKHGNKPVLAVDTERKGLMDFHWCLVCLQLYRTIRHSAALNTITGSTACVHHYCFITGQQSTVQYSTVQYSTVQYTYSTVQNSAGKFSRVQYSTVQYSTVQYSTQYSTQ